MTLVRFEPYRGFEKLARRMNSFSNEIEKGFNFEFGAFSPRVDITEDDKTFFIHAELPGMEKENVKVSVNEDRLFTIKGEKKTEEKKEDKNYIRSERIFGQFERAIILPENLDLEKISAKFENGVLEVSFPKVEPPQPKEIEINIQ
ncbi:MAG: Hsp20/alpha crystallin family protein [Bacteroidota bacterium]